MKINKEEIWRIAYIILFVSPAIIISSINGGIGV